MPSAYRDRYYDAVTSTLDVDVRWLERMKVKCDHGKPNNNNNIMSFMSYNFVFSYYLCC